MKNFKNFVDRHFKEVVALIVFVALIISFAVVAVVNSQIEENKVQQERIDKALHETRTRLDYDQCIADASADYVLNWNGQCKARGLEEDCMLPTSLAVDVDDSLDTAKEMCLELYKLQLTK